MAKKYAAKSRPEILGVLRKLKCGDIVQVVGTGWVLKSLNSAGDITVATFANIDEPQSTRVAENLCDMILELGGEFSVIQAEVERGVKKLEKDTERAVKGAVKRVLGPRLPAADRAAALLEARIAELKRIIERQQSDVIARTSELREAEDALARLRGTQS